MAGTRLAGEGYLVKDGLGEGVWKSRALPLGAASIWAGWAFLTHLPKGSRLCTLALPADAAASVAADLPILGPACADVC